MATTRTSKEPRTSSARGSSTKATKAGANKPTAPGTKSTKAPARGVKVTTGSAKAAKKAPSERAKKAPGKAAKQASGSWAGSTVVYPFAVPMTRESLVKVVAALDELRPLQASYLTFYYLMLEERIAEWRFAGATSNLAAALEQVGVYGATMGLRPDLSPREELEAALEGEVLEVGSPESVRGDNSGATFQDELEEKLPPHKVIVYAKGGAPYDDYGFAVIEVGALGEFAGREPDTRRPEEWPDPSEWADEM